MRKYYYTVLFGSLIFAYIIGGIVPIAFAQQSGSFDGDVVSTVIESSIEPNTYGTLNQTAMIMGSHLFERRTSTTTIESASGVERYITSGGVADAHPILPNGALIERIELRACDSSNTASVTLNFGPCLSPGSACNLAGSVSTGNAETPGCGNFALTLSTPVQVNNQHPILAEISTGTTNATTFSAVKIYYRLQISPAPGEATFIDVSTIHPLFQYIEALAASGITTGYDDGTFRPSQYITRGQMAVFMSRALGLHWPN